MSTKPERKLFRVDINLKYLFLTENTEYGTKDDILAWLHDCHSGELDLDGEDFGAVNIVEVTDKEQIKDYDIGYCVYNDTEDDDIDVENIIKDLHLDAADMVRRLKALGYAVLPPIKNPPVPILGTKVKPKAKKKK